MKFTKLNKKVFGNLSLSLITSILCLAFLIIGLSASTIAVFSEDETYSFVTLKTGKIELDVTIEKQDDELFENSFDNIASKEKNDLYGEETNPYTYLIGEEGLGTYTITITNKSSQNGYFTATISDEVDNENDIEKPLNSFITEINQEAISFEIFTTKLVTLKLDNFTWDKTVEEDEKYISNEDLAIEEFSYGTINVIFKPGFDLLPNGYEEISYISLNQEKFGEFGEQDKSLDFGNSKILFLTEDEHVIPFISPIDSLEGMHLVPCKDSDGFGGFFDTVCQQFFKLNANKDNIVLGPPVFEDSIDTSDFNEPFAYDSENTDLYLPECGYHRLGYTFSYYSYNDEDVTDLLFDDIKYKAINNQDGTIEIIACWNPNKIEIYDEDGSTLTNAYTSEDDISPLINPLTKGGFTFKGYECMNADITIDLNDTQDLIYWKNLIDQNSLIKLKPLFEADEE